MSARPGGGLAASLGAAWAAARAGAGSEARRLSASRMARLTLVALAVVPTLYAGLYLWANDDPYGRLDEVPAALVVEDEGASTGGVLVSLGAQVASDLEADGSFDWQRTDAADAAAGVADGRYEAAVTIPSGFSADLATVQAAVSAGEPAPPRQAQLLLTTNDATSYIGRTVAERVVDATRQAVVDQVGTQTADSFLVGFATVSQQLREAADGATQLGEGLGGAVEGADALTTGAGALVQGQEALVQGTGALADGAGQLADGTGAAVGGVDQLVTGVEQLDAGAGALADGLGQLEDGTAALPAQAQALADGASAVADGNAQVAATATALADASAQAVEGLDAARADLAAQLTALGLDDTQVAAVLEQADGLVAPVRDAQEQVAEADAALGALATGSRQVADGAGALAEAAPALAGGIAASSQGASALAEGTGQLADGVGPLADSARALDQGASALADGASQLADGQEQALAGTQQLADGAGALAEGLVPARDGATALADGLEQGAAGVPALDDDQRERAVGGITDPVATQSTSDATVSGYGAGLAPFFLALSLWIGGYVLFLVVRPLSRRAAAAGRSALGTAVGGYAPALALGVVQAVLLWGVVVGVLRLEPAQPLGLLAMMLLTSAAFVAVVHALVAWLGLPGQFLGLVLLVLQLVSAGGTFPWQTLPAPLASLHHVLPMGYAVDALRALGAGGTDVSARPVLEAVAVLGAYLVVSLVATALAARRRRVVAVSALRPLPA
ncbi:YhgE/Pip domain-containing protein [Pseudokineococcus lusitanus]|uniref:Putative membrane protein n=1 Tax=Pseudokineococcus lusitanus TaxID=763993 RepID=A0A3N1HQG6_9ACTN|nr:YhgE/Pip domain-containing protein [Pseudokineococcus lusitanus]ROP44632.1 putative membrane protein [Pseudokineococcus lusitanus]